MTYEPVTVTRYRAAGDGSLHDTSEAAARHDKQLHLQQTVSSVAEIVEPDVRHYTKFDLEGRLAEAVAETIIDNWKQLQSVLNKKKIRFHVRVNDGPEQTLDCESGFYISAAAAVPAILGYNEYPLHIEIWDPNLLPDYGPYKYVIERAGGPIGQVG